MKKYRLTEETKVINGKTLHRIEALKDFENSRSIPKRIKKGDLGGFVESEANLSQDGSAWITDKAMVLGNAKVKDDALITGFAVVSTNAVVYGSAMVYGYAHVHGDAYVGGSSIVTDNASIYGYCRLGNMAVVCGHAQIFGKSEVYNGYIGDNCKICGNVCISTNIRIGKDSVIKSPKDFIIFNSWWRKGQFFVWTRSNDRWHTNFFSGDADGLIKSAYELFGYTDGKEYERIVKYVEDVKKC